MPTNPNWTRDEVILALDLYFNIAKRKQFDAGHPEVIRLSQFLNKVTVYDTDDRDKAFRNPQGVSMKLGNFVSLDNPGTGLQHASKLDEAVWHDFAEDPARLHDIALSIQTCIEQEMLPITKNGIGLTEEIEF